MNLWQEISPPCEWDSKRDIDWSSFERKCSGIDYVSVRTGTHSGNFDKPYGDWSPFVMRQLQDQFNFRPEHLAWLQEQFVRWRTPTCLPLDMIDLRQVYFIFIYNFICRKCFSLPDVFFSCCIVFSRVPDSICKVHNELGKLGFFRTGKNWQFAIAQRAKNQHKFCCQHKICVLQKISIKSVGTTCVSDFN